MDSRQFQTVKIAGTAGLVIAPVASSADTPVVSAVIDRLGYNSLLVVINSAAATGGTVTLTPSIVEGDSTSPVTAVTLNTTCAIHDCAAAGAELYQFDLEGMNRYIKITVTPVHGSSGTATFSCSAILGSPRLDPPVAATVYSKST